MGNSRWRRLTEERAGGAKSVFHFDVQGSVANQPMPEFPGCGLSADASAPSRPFLAVRRMDFSSRLLGHR